jgi:transcriptional regulator with PAS, ATPase and Fis domain
MRELAQQVELLIQRDSTPALLIGEAGTGRGRLAEHIHARSNRSSHAFVEVNCATADIATLGTDLFGDAGAPEQAPGLVGAVGGGTIFINEVSELPRDLQTRLLSLLDVTAKGDSTSARVVAAASKDLVNEVNTGRFREDLYYKLSVTPVHLPPLRARSREDLSELISATFTALSMNMSNSPHVLGEEVTDCLIAYPWPGNIRELRNVIERALLIARGESVLQYMHLPAELRELQGSEGAYTPRTIMEVERAHIHRTLRAHDLNRTHAARELGISRATLIKKIKEYGLAYPGADHA